MRGAAASKLPLCFSLCLKLRERPAKDNKMKILRLICLLLCCTCVTFANAQDYPVRLIRLILPFPPGGTTDNIARAVAERLAKPLGQSVIIENRGGGGGLIGARAVTSAAPMM